MEAVERRARARIRNRLLITLAILVPAAIIAAWREADAWLIVFLAGIILAPAAAEAVHAMGWRKRKLAELDDRDPRP